MTDMNDWNRTIIEEFRGHGGEVGGQFEGAPMLLLHSVGARTGHERVNPMVYQPDAGRFVVFASKGGSPTHPDWYHNLVANPKVSIEVGTETVSVEAKVATGEERDRLWTQQKKDRPAFADYEQKTTREIPVVILTPLR